MDEATRRLPFDEQWFSTALKSIGDAVIATDDRGRVLFMNPVADALTGWPDGGAHGKDLTEVFPIVNEATRKPVESPVGKILATGHIIGLAKHTVLIARDNKEIPIDDSAAPILDDQGRVAGIILVFRDVTEKRQAELLNDRLAAIVESSDDIIASKTLDGVITSWNRGAERVLGYAAEEVIGRHVSMLMPPELVEDMPKILDRIRRGEKVDHYQTKRRRKDGTIIDVSLIGVNYFSRPCCLIRKCYQKSPPLGGGAHHPRSSKPSIRRRSRQIHPLQDPRPVVTLLPRHQR